MTKTKTLMKGLLGATALTVFTAGNAFAAGTAADTLVSNTFTLSYDVGGVTQPPVTPPAATTFRVDRLVDVLVESFAPVTPSAPGSTAQPLRYRVTNQGNDTHGYLLTAVQEGGDDFNTTGAVITYYIDDGDGIYEPGGDDGAPITYTSGTSTPDIPADRFLHVIISSNVPAAQTDGQTADITLVADTLEGGGSTTPVGPDADGENDIDVTENVLADDSGTSNENANEGDHSATNTLTVGAAAISAVKAVSVFSQDGSGCSTIPGTPATPIDEQYAIPGACIEYTITVENEGSALATDIDIGDNLQPGLEFISASFSGFSGTPSFSPALPTAGTICDGPVGTACRVSMIDGELTGGTPASPTTGVLTIRALVDNGIP